MDKVVLQQILTYLLDNSLIHQAHHGSIKGRSTTTAVTTIVDTWAYLLEEGEELASIAIDQSAAYDLIDHPLLINKMKILGFQQESIDCITSYLKDRTQVVHMDGETSPSLHIGNRSVIQESVMSCALYLIYILDMPTIFHGSIHTIQHTDNCKEPALQTFVDDTICTVIKSPNLPLQTSVDTTMNKIEDYMRANQLALNRDKTQLLILHKDPPLQSKVTLKAQPKDILPSKSIKFLGIQSHRPWNGVNSCWMDPRACIDSSNKESVPWKKLGNLSPFNLPATSPVPFLRANFIMGLSYGGAPQYIKKKNTIVTTGDGMHNNGTSLTEMEQKKTT